MRKNTKQKLYLPDLKKLETFTYIEHNRLSDPLLKQWNINNDKEYTVNPALNDKLANLYGPFIDEGYTAPLYVQWINKKIEYGAFADASIERGQMICEYTGVVEREEPFNEDNLYLWDYPTILYETRPGKKYRKKIVYCVNAEKYGNVGRFVNHSLKKYQNVGIQMIPRNNEWHVVYIALKPIKKDAQLLTNYGPAYWRDRKIIPFIIKP